MTTFAFVAFDQTFAKQEKKNYNTIIKSQKTEFLYPFLARKLTHQEKIETRN